MIPLRFPFVLVALLPLGMAACRGDVYLRDGLTDGDTFYLAPHALMDSDPVLQSWVRYSLTRSTCKLQVGGPNPARVSTYECELRARRQLAGAWDEHRYGDPGLTDGYLDDLARVREAGWLAEYVVYYFNDDAWTIPAGVDTEGFDEWRRRHLRRHRPETRLVGSWNYGDRVSGAVSPW